MKKALSVFLSLCIILTLVVAMPLNVGSAAGTNTGSVTCGDYEYVLYDGYARITNYTGSASDVIIPSKLNGYTVEGIGERAFADHNEITSLTIPACISYIFYLAFENCEGLTRVNISNMKAWYDIDFMGLYSNPLVYAHHLYLNGKPVTEAVFPSDITYIGDSVFAGCEDLIKVTIPSGVISIGCSAFNGCTNLTSIKLPDTIRYLDDSAFAMCGFSEINLPDGVTEIPYCAFESCVDLKSFTVSDSVTEIGSSAFCGCSSMTDFSFGKNVKTVRSQAFSSSAIKNITIPDSVESIENQAFFDCKNLKTVYLGSGLSSLGEETFVYCTSLESIKISEKNKSFDSRGNCNAIIRSSDGALITGCKNTIVPYGVKSIGDKAFYECEGLTKLVLPDSVESIGEFAISFCYDLELIEFGSGLKSFADYALYDCRLLTDLYIPASVNSIGEAAFSFCSCLSCIEVDLANPVFDSRDDCNAIIETKTNKLIRGCIYTEIPDSVTCIGDKAFEAPGILLELNIPDGVTSIGECAFMRSFILTEIEIPDSVTYIGEEAFSMSGIYSVKLPSRLKTIPRYMFDCCTRLREVTIPDSVTKIDDYAFLECESLSSVILGNSVVEIGEGAFNDCPELKSIVIPESVTSIGENAIGYQFWDEKIAGFTIYGHPDTEAQRYAEENGFDFVDVTTEPHSPQDHSAKKLAGDADTDGYITILDATVIQRHLASLKTEKFNERSADADEDGEVTIMDATSIQRYLAGLPTNKGIGREIK